MKNDKIFAQEKMNMNFRLISLNLSGMKSIEKEIEFSFVKKNFGKEIFETSFLKTIYGPNGSGKTAVVSAFNVYKTLLLNEFPFKMGNYNDLLTNLINKKTKRFVFSVIFAVLDDEDEILRIKHHIEVSSDVSGQYYISKENIYLLNPRLDEPKPIFISNEGVVVSNEVKDITGDIDPIVLKNNSIVKNYYDKMMQVDFKNNDRDATKYEKAMGYIEVFAHNLFVAYGERQDTHIGHFSDWALSERKSLNAIAKNEYMVNRLKDTMKNSIPGVRCFDVIFDNSLQQYKKQVKKMEKFVRLLKKDLVRIDVKTRAIEQLLLINLEFVYKDYAVDYEFESTGVKKTCLLFSGFVAAKNGCITLIDEIDSNIHDTFLVKLIDYFVTYTDSQIICTTHNVEIMDIAASYSKSIDFLSSDNRVVSWIKTGRLSPSTLYLRGRIKFIPFNLDSSEFAEVFSDE